MTTKRKDDGVSATISIGGGEPMPFNTPADFEAAKGPIRKMLDGIERPSPRLAIDDPEYSEKIRLTRITTPVERTIDMRLRRVKERMESVNALDPETTKGKKNRAKLELITEKPQLLFDLEKDYLTGEERERDGSWPASAEGQAFFIHDEAVQITLFVVSTYRTELRRYRIAVVMAKKIPPTLRRGRLGTATKLPGKMRFLAEYDALITLDWEHWSMLTDRDRQRLIHHELEHLEVGDKGLQLCPHDFEDFIEIVDIYGLQSESERFSTDGQAAKALARGAAQLELLQTA